MLLSGLTVLLFLVKIFGIVALKAIKMLVLNFSRTVGYSVEKITVMGNNDIPALEIFKVILKQAKLIFDL